MRAGLSILVSLGLVSATFGDVTYSDSNFAEASWGFDYVPTPILDSGIASVSQSPAGNPGTGRRHDMETGTAAGDRVYAMSRYGTTLATRYEPMTQGGIVLLDASFDHRIVTSGGQDGLLRVGVALKQSSFIYVAALGPTSSVWTTRQSFGLSALDFVRADGEPGNPDFSSFGSPIRFGFASTQSTAGGTVITVVDFDNFRCKVWTTCPADLDNGTFTGVPDGGIDISDLLYFLQEFEAGGLDADIDDGFGTGTPDGGVDISDLLYFLARYEAGC